MAKENGLGWTTFDMDDAAGVARQLVNDVPTCSWDMARGIQDTTGLDKSARETLLLLSDFQSRFDMVFNDAANQGFDVVKTVGSTSVPRTQTMAISGQTLPNEVNISNVSHNRSQGGEWTMSVTTVLQDGTVPTWA
jgi:hypothetical protein